MARLARALLVALGAGGWGCGETLVDHGADPHLTALVCAPDLVACDGQCLACAPPRNAHAICAASACGFDCDEGFHRCSADACVAESPTSCGPACADCSTSLPEHASPLCTTGGRCDFECAPGYLRSGASCLRAVALSAGFEHTCALTSDARMRCWGLNEHGQLGDGTTHDRSVPVDVLLPGPVSSISAGYDHSCAIAAGEVYCWGDNTFGEIGDGTKIERWSPVRVAGLSGASSVTAGGCGADAPGTAFGHTCAVVAGNVRCWGSNGSGQVGDGGRSNRTTPTPVTVLPRGLAVTSVSIGERHTCALAGDQVYCWGANDSGQLGVGPVAPLAAPVAPTIAAGAWALGTGQAHGCALVGAALQCWGLNTTGQVDYEEDERGDGEGNDVSGGAPAAYVWPMAPTLASVRPSLLAVGRAHTCVVDTSGTPARAACFGADDAGQLGGLGSDRVELEVGGGSSVKAISAGAAHTCILTGEGAIQCWGSNQSGQLGDGSFADSWRPVDVSGR